MHKIKYLNSWGAEFELSATKIVSIDGVPFQDTAEEIADRAYALWTGLKMSGSTSREAMAATLRSILRHLVPVVR